MKTLDSFKAGDEVQILPCVFGKERNLVGAIGTVMNEVPDGRYVMVGFSYDSTNPVYLNQPINKFNFYPDELEPMGKSIIVE